LQILDPTSYSENPNSVDPLKWQIRKAEADMYMQGVAARIRESLSDSTPQGINDDETQNRVVYAIREGKTAENIVNFAHTEAIDLLVISTHGSGGLSRWNISSVTQKVTNLIYLPVLIVRAYNQPETEDARIYYRRILLPIDSSRRAECALSAGIALARAAPPTVLAVEGGNLSTEQNTRKTAPLQTKLILAAVIKPPELPIPEPYPIEIEQLSGQLMHVTRLSVDNYLNELKERLSVECEAFIIENPSVSSAIHDLANQTEDIDLVVLCAHGYTGQSTWPYGNVARNYMEHGSKPVLVIQDVLRSQVPPTAAEVAAEASGGR
jgi:nucleotide-binding universal stress UspA family protein